MQTGPHLSHSLSLSPFPTPARPAKSGAAAARCSFVCSLWCARYVPDFGHLSFSTDQAPANDARWRVSFQNARRAAFPLLPHPPIATVLPVFRRLSSPAFCGAAAAAVPFRDRIKNTRSARARFSRCSPNGHNAGVAVAAMASIQWARVATRSPVFVLGMRARNEPRSASGNCASARTKSYVLIIYSTTIYYIYFLLCVSLYLTVHGGRALAFWRNGSRYNIYSQSINTADVLSYCE